MKNAFLNQSPYTLQYEIDLSKPFELPCPIRILHGLDDQEVDPLQSKYLAQIITSQDVDLIYRKSGSHQLENPPDIELFLNTLDRMLKANPIDWNLLPSQCFQSFFVHSYYSVK